MRPIDQPYTFLINRVSAVWLLRAITIACGSGFMLFGYDQGVLGGLLTGTPFQAQFPALTTNSTLQGATVAIYEIGCAFGALGIFFWGEKLGRRRGIIYGMVILSIGAILQFMSYGLAQMIVGRIVTGLGNGMTTSTIPVWHSETSMSHNRGRNVCIELGVNIFGVMLAYWVDYGLRNNETGYQWRLPLALQVVFAVVTIFFVCFLPESPRWLANQGRVEEAREVIFMLETLEGDAREKATDVRLESILEAIRVERAAGTSSFKDCFRNGEQRFLHRVLLGCGSQMMQQVSGINLITYYAPVIFQKSVGLSRDRSLLLSGFNGLAYFVSSLVPIPLIERLGRRKLMLFGAVGMSICMALLAAMTEDTENFAKGVVASVCLFLFNFFFSVGWLAIPWLYPAEIAPLQIRAKAAALSTATNWLFTFLVVMITPVAIDSIAWKTYIVWACTNFVFVPITYFFYVETTGQTLEDIDLLFEGETSWVLGPSSARRAAEIRARRRAEEEAKIKGGYAGSDSDEKLRGIPTVGANSYFLSFITGFKSFKQGRTLVQEGYEKFQGQIYKIPLFTRWNVVVTTPQHIDDIRKASDDSLSFEEAVNETLQTVHTLGKAVADDPWHVPVVRGALTRNIGAKFDDVREEIVAAFEDEMPATTEWTKRRVTDSIFKIVARASNRLFVGLPLCRNPEFLDLNIRFTIQVVVSAMFINVFPEFLKPYVGGILTSVPKSIKEATRFLEPVIVERLQQQEQYGKDWPEKPNDFLSWLIDAASDSQRNVHDLVMRILTINFAAIHTSSMAFTDALYALAAHPQYVDELREEIEAIVEEHGWSKASLQQMRKLDSFLKETERTMGMGGLISDRRVLKDFTFSDGTTIPAGSTISIPNWAVHHDEKYYEDPHIFKPFRFAEMREDNGEGMKHQMVTPTMEYFLFGVGRHACPGRFFAVNELKTLITHVLMNYDVRFENLGVVPEPTWVGIASQPNQKAEVMFRKRQK
ncbi:hypothetical protein VNI00_004533 [Paramarasmius palmivorus]|uniref:Major facilitator superfamily (MFS) profile domain-containing protein n=1 Tax=Paramarasmius palmivorus TaxID=297713 RepID=A0AAW0DJK7_9AGAR